jgi:hypothetical protein
MCAVELQRLTVDGEVFDVVAGEAPGRYHYDWVSGRIPGYGFSSAVSDGSSLTVEQHVDAIRGFLAAVDPATGYIEDGDKGV